MATGDYGRWRGGAAVAPGSRLAAAQGTLDSGLMVRGYDNQKLQESDVETGHRAGADSSVLWRSVV